MRSTWDGFFIAVAVVAVGWAALHLKTGPATAPTEVIQWLEELRAQCDPDQPGNDYLWSTNTQPTERRRMDLLARLTAGPRDTALAIRQLEAEGVPDEEFRQMLVLASLSAKNEASVQSACRLMAWSGYPAVRICAARMLRTLKKPSCAEWFALALDDDRVVLNNGCGMDGDGRLYPVRLIASLALQDLGMTDAQISELQRGGEPPG